MFSSKPVSWHSQWRTYYLTSRDTKLVSSVKKMIWTSKTVLKVWWWWDWENYKYLKIWWKKLTMERLNWNWCDVNLLTVIFCWSSEYISISCIYNSSRSNYTMKCSSHEEHSSCSVWNIVAWSFKYVVFDGEIVCFIPILTVPVLRQHQVSQQWQAQNTWWHDSSSSFYFDFVMFVISN